MPKTNDTRRLAPVGNPEEVHRTEQILGLARCVLALTCLAGIPLFRMGVRGALLPAYLLLSIYTVYALLLTFLMRAKTSTSTILREIQGIDVGAAALIGMITGPESLHFLFFYVFVILAAAFRWGSLETLISSGLVIVAVFGRELLQSTAAFYQMWQREVIEVVYLLAIGLLAGRLAAQQKRFRSEAATIARIMGNVRVHAGIKGSLEAVLGSLMRLFDCTSALLALEETATSRSFLWEASWKDGETNLIWRELKENERSIYFADLPAPAFYGERKNSGEWALTAISGRTTRSIVAPLPPNFIVSQRRRPVLYVTFDLEEEILGRLFLFSSHPRKSVGSELRLLNEVVRQLGPAVYNVYELRRLRSRAAAMERAWIARELHDGAIQALAGITMRLYVLRKKLLAEHNLVGGEVEEIQRLLSDQIVNLRRLIQHVKPVDVDPRRLLDTLAATIDQFRSDTGIATKFVSDLHEIIVPARISREILQIVREALVNIHKHSHATNVLVRVAAERGHWVIVIEDNGRGFEFVGRLRQSELDAARQGPTIIKERVRSCGGELLIESTPGRGARLEVMIPQVAEEVHA